MNSGKCSCLMTGMGVLLSVNGPPQVNMAFGDGMVCSSVQ